MTTLRRIVSAAAVVATVAMPAGCSSSGPASIGSSVGSSVGASAGVKADLPLRLELIRPALTALEAKLGGPQHYFEVNATPTLVNLFVANSANTQATAYVFTAGSLGAPAAPEQVKAGAPTFTTADIAFDQAHVLDPVLVALPESTYRVFSIVGVANGGAAYLVTMQSAKGGDFQVPVKPDGSLISRSQK
ncbi:MAG: hypothetical protein WCK14_10570 [Actinomycetota bacterium]|jgi:hypothetical protein